MTNLNGHFAAVEVTGSTKEEALSKAPFQIMGDATQAYKNWASKQTEGLTEAAKKQFYLDYLQKKTKNTLGVGFAITLESAVEDSRLRPYTIVDVKNEKGKRKYRTTFQITSDKTHAVLKMVDTTKADAKKAIKELYKNGLKDDVTMTYTKQVVEGEAVACKGKYSPSKNTRVGVYLVFGIVAD